MNTHKEPKQCKHGINYMYADNGDAWIFCKRCKPHSQPPQEEQPKEWEEEFDEMYEIVTSAQPYIDYKNYRYSTIHAAIKHFIKEELANQRSEIVDAIVEVAYVSPNDRTVINLTDALKIMEGFKE